MIMHFLYVLFVILLVIYALGIGGSLEVNNVDMVVMVLCIVLLFFKTTKWNEEMIEHMEDQIQSGDVSVLPMIPSQEELPPPQSPSQ